MPVFDGIRQDLRVSIRALRATPIVTAVAVLSLALGIGATTAIFSVVNSLLVRALPVKDPGRLVLVTQSSTAGTRTWSYPLWEELRQRPELFDGVVTWAATHFSLTSGGERRVVEGLWVNGTFFDTLGVPAWLGRTFSASDDRRGGGPDGPVTLISYRFWQRHFRGAADVVGRTLILDHHPFTIVGVTPPGFFGVDVGRTFDVVVPLGNEPLLRGRGTWLDSRSWWLAVMARLKPGQTVDAAAAGLRGVQSQIREAALPRNWPQQDLDRYRKESFVLVQAASGTSSLRRRYERPLLTIMIVVSIVLVVACANIANLLLARATARRSEFAVRLALGASGWRIARQLLTESAVLACTGAAFGLLIASWGSRVLVRQLSTTTTTVFLNLSIDGHVLAFTAGVTVATALLFGCVPALRSSRLAPLESLKEDGRGPVGGGRIGLASGLVVAQVALSVVVVAAAGLFVRTFASLATRELGFSSDRVLVAGVDAERAAPDPAQRMSLFERTLEAVRVLPGVTDAAISFLTPVSDPTMIGLFEQLPDAPALAPSERRTAVNFVSPDWFDTLGTPLVAGRDFTDRDRKGTLPVAVVNETFARKFFPGVNPLGRTIILTVASPTSGPPIEIIGIAGDAVYNSLRDAVPATTYLPLAQLRPQLASVNLSVRSTGPPAMLARSLAAGIAAVNPQLTVTFRPLSDQVDAALTQERLIAWLSALFGALALLLAGIGLYGVTSYAVSRRRTEIGIRMALGAGPAGVVRLVLSRVLALVGIGAIVGAGASAWASQFVAALLYGLEPRDPATLLGAAVTLAAVGALAGWLPAWRAARIDPAEVLRRR